MKILDAALTAHWAIEEHALDLVLKIAAREHEVTPEALEAYRAKALERALKSIYSSLFNLLGPLTASEETWRGWGYAAGNAIGRVDETIAALGSKIVAKAGEFGSSMAKLARAGWNAFMAIDWTGLGKAIVEAIINGISAMGSALAAKLGEIAASGAAKIKGLFNLGGGSTPASSASPKPIEARAKGGPVIGGKTYLVGERGPELFRAPTSGVIVPNHRLQRLTSPETIAQATGRQGRNVTIGDTNVTVSITTQGDPEAIAKAAARAVRDQIRRMQDEQHALLSD